VTEAARVEPAEEVDPWVECLRHVPGMTAVYWTEAPAGVTGGMFHEE